MQDYQYYDERAGRYYDDFNRYFRDCATQEAVREKLQKLLDNPPASVREFCPPTRPRIYHTNPKCLPVPDFTSPAWNPVRDAAYFAATKIHQQDLTLPDLPALRDGIVDIFNWYCSPPLAQKTDLQDAAGKDEGQVLPPAPTIHSEDFHSVGWYGQEYKFSHQQAAVVKVLWEAWEKNTPDLGKDYILEISGSGASRLRDIFKEKHGMHPAWGTMIAKSKQGVFRLSAPSKKF